MPKRPGYTMIEVTVCVAIIGVLAALLLPAVLQARSAARRTQCQNNLRNIGVGFANYESTFGEFPAGLSSWDHRTQPGMSWGTRLLPYIEQPGLWALTEEGYAQSNWPLGPLHPAREVSISLYACPADSRVASPQFSVQAGRRVGLASYLGVAGKDHRSTDGVLFYESQIKPRDILDGLSNTLMVGERPPSDSFNYGWWYSGGGQDGRGTLDTHLGVLETPRTPTLPIFYDCEGTGFAPGQSENDCDLLHFWSQHPSGADFLLCDGSVRFFAYEGINVLPALATRSGREVVDGN